MINKNVIKWLQAIPSRKKTLISIENHCDDYNNKNNWQLCVPYCYQSVMIISLFLAWLHLLFLQSDEFLCVVYKYNSACRY